MKISFSSKSARGFALLHLMTYLTLLWGAVPLSAFTEIKQLDPIELAVANALRHHLPEDILVVFDVDHVLTDLAAPELQQPNKRKFRHLFQTHIKSLPEAQRHLLQAYILFTEKVKLIDQRMPRLISTLQRRGVKTLALTGAYPSYKLPKSKETLAQRRYKNLKKLGIDFSKSFSLADHVYTERPGALGQSPAFHKGILMTASAPSCSNKGWTLHAFLKRHHYNPRVIIFVDDEKAYLEDVSQIVAQSFPQVHFTGFWYTANKEAPAPAITENRLLKKIKALKKRALFQKGSS